MIRRLIEADHAACQGEASAEQVKFWLREARTPGLLIELAGENPAVAATLALKRPLLEAALNGDETRLEEALYSEERAERLADRTYWEPLKRELEQLRNPPNG